MSNRRRILHGQFLEEAKAQGTKSGLHIVFVCPACKTLQTAQELIDAGAGADMDAVQPYLGYSCIGRFRGIRGLKKDGRGCDWTLGGLLQMHDLEIEMEGSGNVRPCFELATPEAAQEHVRKLIQAQEEPQPAAAAA